MTLERAHDLQVEDTEMSLEHWSPSTVYVSGEVTEHFPGSAFLSVKWTRYEDSTNHKGATDD